MILDISHYQGQIDWKKLTPQLDFLIMRASCGLTRDKKYLDYAAQCKVPFGAYHYCKANSAEEAKREADFFFDTAKTANPLFYVVDIECAAQNGANTNEIFESFIRSLRMKGACKTGLYICQSKYPYIKNLSLTDFIWIPRYGKEEPKPNLDYQPIYPCDLWQYTSKGKVDGISGYVDINVLHGDKTIEWFTSKECEKGMSVKIGAARINEKCSISGGRPGDQNGDEVRVQPWYLHNKGWRVLRCKDTNKAEQIAVAMEHACKNDMIGYDQPTRNTLYREVEDKGFDPAKTSKKVNCDCSSLVRVCCAFAGILVRDFITSNEASILMATGLFEELNDNKYIMKPDYLRRGDILVTRVKGHTVVVMNDGPLSGNDKTYKLGDRDIKKGDEGADVRELQTIYVDYYQFDIGDYGEGGDGVDGQYGSKCVAATKKLQKMLCLKETGIFDKNTYKVMMDSISDDDGGQPSPGQGGDLTVTGGSVNVRAGIGTQYPILLVVHKDDKLMAVKDENCKVVKAKGWYAVDLQNDIGWISGKYVR